ncbi:hypothetical protein DH2020_040104 [Rehmannia glutinosa]|uniref:Uncharacterized protein n=1 Tax=Rehmannia glutinosa TaxID=99300 RepID=A0ABR0UUE9_REHGL
MPRYGDSHGSNTRLYVGHLSSRTQSRDLEHVFSRYGSSSWATKFHELQYVSSYDGLTVSDNHFRRVRDVDMKRDYAFVEFSDPRDADDARYSLNGRDVDGRRITVEFAKGTPRGPGGAREYGSSRGPTPGSGRCFNCGIEGHWARDCKAGDWKNKCYRCGERGHVERNCQNSPKKLSRSRSPVRRGRDEERRSRSPDSRSPKVNRRASPSKTRKRSPTPDNDTRRERESASPKGYSDNSPKETSRSPVVKRPDDESPFDANGHNRSPSASPRDDKSPGVDENNIGYPRSSESP